MCDDLLDAKAAVNWAVAQLESFCLHSESWCKSRPYSLVGDDHPEIGKKLIRLKITKKFPAILNAEAGAILNSIRSALDLLANGLAVRNGHSSPKNTQFPVCKDESAFLAGKHAGRKEIKLLSDTDQTTIQKLKPWNGGNDTLWTLHTLDIQRKHRRLIDVTALPTGFRVTPEVINQGLVFPPRWAGFKNEAIVASTNINATQYDFDIPLQVAFEDAGPFTGKNVCAMLYDFAGTVIQIISQICHPPT